MDDKSKCENCSFWKPSEDKKSGQCHRYAPRAILSIKLDRVLWPATGPDDFCGDHKLCAPGEAE